MNYKRILLIVMGCTILILSWYYYFNSQTRNITVERISPSVKPVKWEIDLNWLIAEAHGLGTQIPNQVPLATDVVQECEKMKTLFAESFQLPIQGSIDFILQVHPPASGAPSPPGMDPDRSRELISRLLLANKYDLVTIEGSGFDGFSVNSSAMETIARLKYEPTSPLYQSLVKKGVDPTSSFRALPFVAQMMSAVSNPDLKAWRELEPKIPTPFLAGESLPISILLDRLVMHEIDSPTRDSVIEHIQRVRDEYVLAKTIKDIRERQAKYGAIIFGYMHGDDFKILASSLGLTSKIYDATGMRK